MIIDYPCRVVLALPISYLSSTLAWSILHTCQWYRMAEGMIPQTDTCVHYCIVSDSAAMEKWQIHNALIVAHLGPLCTAMKMQLHTVPSELRADHTHTHMTANSGSGTHGARRVTYVLTSCHVDLWTRG